MMEKEMMGDTEGHEGERQQKKMQGLADYISTVGAGWLQGKLSEVGVSHGGGELFRPIPIHVIFRIISTSF